MDWLNLSIAIVSDLVKHAIANKNYDREWRLSELAKTFIIHLRGLGSNLGIDRKHFLILFVTLEYQTSQVFEWSIHVLKWNALKIEWHFKTGQICMVFKWSNCILPFENWTKNRMFQLVLTILYKRIFFYKTV